MFSISGTEPTTSLAFRRLRAALTTDASLRGARPVADLDAAGTRKSQVLGPHLGFHLVDQASHPVEPLAAHLLGARHAKCDGMDVQRHLSRQHLQRLAPLPAGLDVSRRR
jgi:hypothetical protein